VHVEVLYFDGCPTYVAAARTLREVLAELGAEVELVAVDTDEEAKRLRFPGSPTSGWTVGTSPRSRSAASGRWVAGRTPHPRA